MFEVRLLNNFQVLAVMWDLLSCNCCISELAGSRSHVPNIEVNNEINI